MRFSKTTTKSTAYVLRQGFRQEARNGRFWFLFWWDKETKLYNIQVFDKDEKTLRLWREVKLHSDAQRLFKKTFDLYKKLL